MACLATTGCSFAFVSGPPAAHRQMPYFECSSSRAAPILDTIWTVLQLGNLAVLASQSDAEFEDNFAPNDPPFSRKTNMGLNAAFAALGAAGAYYGYTKTSECRAAKNELIMRMGNNGMQPQQPGYGTWPPGPPAPAPAPAPQPAPEPAPSPEPAPAPEPMPAPPPNSMMLFR